MNIIDKMKLVRSSLSLHHKIETAKNLLLKESEINNKTHTLTSDDFNLSVAELIALAKDDLVKLDNYFLQQGYINEYKRKKGELKAKLHKLEIASLGSGGSSYYKTRNPFIDEYCGLGKGYYEKLINNLKIELDIFSFEDLARQDISQKFINFDIKFSPKKIQEFLNEKIDSFIKEELELSTDKTHRLLSYQKQKEDFVIGMVGELVKGYSRNNLKIDYTQIWGKDVILKTSFIETALGMEREGLIEIKDIIYPKIPNQTMVMTSDEFWKYPTIIQLKALPNFDTYCGLIRGKFAPLIREGLTFKKEEKKQETPEKKGLFPLPLNIKNITFKFKNDFDVDVIIGKDIYSSDYKKMGFADKRVKKSEEKTKANDAWVLLVLLSASGGIFPIDSLTGKAKKQKIKQKQLLSKDLRAIFPTIKDDPFYKYDDRDKNYKIKMKLIPEKTFRDDFRDKDIKFKNSKSEPKSYFNEMRDSQNNEDK